jgi:hypothetical protein
MAPRFDDDVHQIFTVSKDDLLKMESRDRRKKERKNEEQRG